jgi:hypothetical protein
LARRPPQSGGATAQPDDLNLRQPPRRRGAPVQQSPSRQTLALGLRGPQNVYNTGWDFTMAGAVLMTTPMVAVFFLAQRFFIEGMSAFGGLGGR